MIFEVEVLTDNPFLKKIVYKYNDQEVAYLNYSLIYDKMEINDVYVEEKFRNQKIATKLLSYLVSLAITNHVVNITLEVRISNAGARHLYQKFGFREVALRKNYYGNESGILMEKQVM